VGLAEEGWSRLDVADAARLDVEAVIGRLGTSGRGLGAVEARRRLEIVGPNAFGGRRVRPLFTIARQFNNPLLLLLAAAAITSLFVGEHTDAGIIILIVALSVVLGFVNEYRSERAIEDLHSRVSHTATAFRDGEPCTVDITTLVPGDFVHLDVGDVVPADLRLTVVNGLECDEAALTGEPDAVEKSAIAGPAAGGSPTESSCAYMGTIVRAGTGDGFIVKTGLATAFGRIAHHLDTAMPVTAFQRGLRDFSGLIVGITGVLTVSIFVLNAIFNHPLLESLLFALAIAVGLTPQLLPAIVTISLSTGAQRLAARSVIVKRLVAIEDFGNVEILFTDKTGTLTLGRTTYAGSMDAAGAPSPEVFKLGLACNSSVVTQGRAVGGNALDAALWEAADSAGTAPPAFARTAELPFDFQRRLMSVVVRDGSGTATLVVKGAPESVIARCIDVDPKFQATLDAQFSAGSRVVAVATKPWPGDAAPSHADEYGLHVAGLLLFVDPPKSDAAASLRRLDALGVELKIATGDNERVTQKVCADLGVVVRGTLTGGEIEALDDAHLREAIGQTTIFARVSPEQKSRLIKLARAGGTEVGFLGDGVNDAVALHDADVGISVDSACDVAKDAADIVLLEKDLGILADGVVEGRRVFENTIKYVLMGTSSNFGNMFSAAGASLFLSFLPMLPSQILLNNLLYDTSEMTIPTDNIDLEMLRRPAHWDMAFIRRFMLLFGPISSVFDFITFGVMLWVFRAGESLFQTGWFVESLLTQSLVIFVIRTRRTPFFRSRPSTPLLLTTIACVAVAVILPFSPLAATFGFVALPGAFFGVLIGMIAVYLVLAEAGKILFYRQTFERPAQQAADRRRLHRIAGRFRRPTALLKKDDRVDAPGS
jgi:Mg2+-importing ATPase